MRHLMTRTTKQAKSNDDSSLGNLVNKIKIFGDISITIYSRNSKIFFYNYRDLSATELRLLIFHSVYFLF